MSGTLLLSRWATMEPEQLEGLRGYVVAEQSRGAVAEIERLGHENEQLREHIWQLSSFAGKAYEYWYTERDRKAGEILLAMGGELPGYYPEIDAALAEAKPPTNSA